MMDQQEKMGAMDIQEQQFSDEQSAPHSDRLAEIEAVVMEARDPVSALGEREALRRIGLIVARGTSGETYQKPLG